jgi:leucyl-tRNA synthetase
MWEMLGHGEPLARGAWPAFDADAARAAEIVVPVQVNGKLRARLTVPVDASEEALRTIALADQAVRHHTDGKTVRKVVIAKGKLVNIVVS